MVATPASVFSEEEEEKGEEGGRGGGGRRRKEEEAALRVQLGAEHLPSMCESLCSLPSTMKRKKKERI